MSKALIISIHDLSPSTWRICQSFIDEIRKEGEKKFALLVIPAKWGEKRVTEDGEFFAWIKAMEENGHEIVLHGFSHRTHKISGGPINQFMGRFYTDFEGEFYQIREMDAKRLIKKGISLLSEIDVSVYGFTPPAWLLSREGYRALKNMGFHYTTELNHINLLSHDCKRIYAPSFVFSSRAPWRRHISKMWVNVWAFLNKKADIVRIEIHPVDLIHKDIKVFLKNLIYQGLKRRKLILYKDLISQKLCPLPINIHERH